jgi:hypothetical protein
VWGGEQTLSSPPLLIPGFSKQENWQEHRMKTFIYSLWPNGAPEAIHLITAADKAAADALILAEILDGDTETLAEMNCEEHNTTSAGTTTIWS